MCDNLIIYHSGNFVKLLSEIVGFLKKKHRRGKVGGGKISCILFPVIGGKQVERFFVLFDSRESSCRLIEMVIDIVVVDL